MKKIKYLAVILALIILTATLSAATRPRLTQQEKDIKRKLNKIVINDDEDEILIINQIKQMIPKHKNPDVLKHIYKKIGDIHFRKKNFRSMKPWYEKVVEIDPSMEKRTTIAHHMKVANTHILIENLTFGTYGLYLIFFILFLIRIVTSYRTFDWRYFLKRNTVFLLLFTALFFLAVYIDSLLMQTSGENLVNYKEFKNLIVKPVAVFSFAHNSFEFSLLLIFVMTYLPTIFAITYMSFKKSYSPLVLRTAVVLLCANITLSFMLKSIINPNPHLFPKYHGFSIYFKGDIETQLMKYPKEIIKTNKGFSKLENTDLKSFIQINFPQGVDAYIKQKKDNEKTYN